MQGAAGTTSHNGGVIAGLDPAIHERLQRRQPYV